MLNLLETTQGLNPLNIVYIDIILAVVYRLFNKVNYRPPLKKTLMSDMELMTTQYNSVPHSLQTA